MRSIDAMFVWTPNTEWIDARAYPLKGNIDVTTMPEQGYTRLHSKSYGACNFDWKMAERRWQMAQQLVTMMIHEDNIPVKEVRKAFRQVDEFATFPFSTDLLETKSYELQSQKRQACVSQATNQTVAQGKAM
jgi:hypothetical protein